MSGTTSQSSTAGYRFDTKFKLVAFITVVNSIMSLMTNSIYVNNYMMRKTKLFGNILTVDEKNIIIGTLITSILSFLFSVGYLIYKYKNRPIYCNPLQTETTTTSKDKVASTTTAAGSVTQKMIDSKMAQPAGCNVLPICANDVQQEQNDKISDSTLKICTPHYYGTTILTICNLVISIGGLTMSSILLADTTVNKTLTHETNTSSDVTFTVAIIFAVLSASIPVLLATYTIAVYKTHNTVTQIVEKTSTVAGTTPQQTFKISVAADTAAATKT